MNSKKYLIDTNILIYYFNGDIPVENVIIDKVFSESFYISVISQIEFLSWSGFLVDTDSFLNARTFISHANVLNISDEVVKETIRIRQMYKIKIADSLIAGTAIQDNLTLVTRNVKDFKNLDIEIYNPFAT